MSLIDDLFRNIFDTSYVNTFTIGQFLMCVGCALLTGLMIAGFYLYRGQRYTSTFVMTIALLPAIVTVVILVVGNNIGAGIAVAGAFSLVKFRSAPGTAKEIAFIFLAMSAGLLIGAGYLAYSVLFAAIIGMVYTLYNAYSIRKNTVSAKRTLRVTVPEDLDYTGLLDDVFDQYTSDHCLSMVKTTNMGTMFRLTYSITMIDQSKEKEMIDRIRCRNGNLEVQVYDSYDKYREL